MNQEWHKQVWFWYFHETPKTNLGFSQFSNQFWQKAKTRKQKFAMRFSWKEKKNVVYKKKHLYSMYWDIGETEFDLPCDGLGLAVVWRLIQRFNSAFIFKSFVLGLSKYKDDLIWPCWNWASQIVCLSRWSWILKLSGESGMT